MYKIKCWYIFSSSLSSWKIHAIVCSRKLNTSVLSIQKKIGRTQKYLAWGRFSFFINKKFSFDEKNIKKIRKTNQTYDKREARNSPNAPNGIFNSDSSRSPPFRLLRNSNRYQQQHCTATVRSALKKGGKLCSWLESELKILYYTFDEFLASLLWYFRFVYLFLFIFFFVI